jgi:hypothetical protein
MHWKLFIESNVIRTIDLGGKEHLVEIVKIERGKVTGSGGKQSGKAMLWLKGKDKPIACGSTVLRTIAGMYGEDTRSWPGKQIVIYPDMGVRNPSDGTMGGIRVRPVVPKEGGGK